MNPLEEKQNPSVFSGREKPVLILVLVLFTCAIYGQTLSHGFVNFDDSVYVTENPMVKKGLSVPSVTWAFTRFHEGNYHPLTWLSLMLDISLFGVNPGLMHMVNLIFHLLAAILFFHALHLYTRKLWPSFLVALLFAVHPMHVESVAWISQRKDLLCACFFVLALLAYHRWVLQKKTRDLVLVHFLYLLGLLAKPMMITLPFVLLLLDYAPLGRYSTPAEKNGRPPFFLHLLREKAGLFLIALVFHAVTVLAVATPSLSAVPVSARVANAFFSLGKYLLKTLLPVNLSVFYPFDPRPEAIALLPALFCAGAVMGITVFFLSFLKKFPMASVGWFWFLITISPVLGFIPQGIQSMADRYTYIPHIGLFLVPAFSLPDIRVFAKPARAGIIIAISLVIIALTALAHKQTGYWKNGLTLFSHAKEVSGPHPLILNNLGRAWEEAGNPEKAEALYREAAAKNPLFYQPEMNLGLLLAKTGKTEEAIIHLENALRIRPWHPDIHRNLGLAYAKTEEYETALRHMKNAARLRGNSPVAKQELNLLRMWINQQKESIP